MRNERYIYQETRKEPILQVAQDENLSEEIVHGIYTTLPCLTDTDKDMENVIAAVAEAGADFLIPDVLDQDL